MDGDDLSNRTQFTVLRMDIPNGISLILALKDVFRW